MKTVVALVATLAMVGCTSSQPAAVRTPSPSVSLSPSPTPSPTPVITHRQFIRVLDSMCRKVNKRLDAINRQYPNPTYDQAARLWTLGHRVSVRFFRQIKALDVPMEDMRGFERYLTLTRQLLVLQVRMIRALRAHDDDEITRLSGLIDSIRNQRTRVTSQMGLTVCGG